MAYGDAAPLTDGKACNKCRNGEQDPRHRVDPVLQPEPILSDLQRLLLKVDHAEQTVCVSVRACGEEQLVGVAIHPAALAESQRP
jgi:hypothetical protein